MGSQFGSQVLGSVAANGHLNANGVEIVSIALGIEDNAGFDQRVMQDPARWGFDLAGVDCVLDGSDRTEIREGFAYYTGLSPSRIPGTGQRRAFVILNGVTNSPSHKPWELLHFSHGFSSTQSDSLLALIDSVMPGDGSGGGGDPTGQSYTEWMAEAGLPDAAPLEDGDGDGLSNVVEFYFDTPPGQANPSPLQFSSIDGTFRLAYPVGKDRTGVTVGLETSTSLAEWQSLDVPEGDWVLTEGESVDQVDVSLPADMESFVRLRVTLSD